MTTSLEDRIRAALRGDDKGAGVLSFENSQSAIAKAKEVIQTLDSISIQLDLSKTVFVSIGGADGTEAEHILRQTPIKTALLFELDRVLSAGARGRAKALQSEHLRLEVYEGDVTQTLDTGLELVKELYSSGETNAIVVSMQAVLHELPDRASGSTDLEHFLHKFLWMMPVVAITREPCMPDSLPPVVHLITKSPPEVLLGLANYIRSKHPLAFGSGEPPVAFAEKLRMSSRLAVETIWKLFYLDSLRYEIGEKITSLTREELILSFRNVFGNDNVETAALQTKSFTRLWSELGIGLETLDQKKIHKPEIHTRIVAYWTPRNSSGTTESIPSPPLHDGTPSRPLTRDAQTQHRDRIRLAELGILDWERFKKEPIHFGEQRQSLRSALKNGQLFRRHEMDDLQDQLAMRGTALVVGPGGTGKTTMSFLLADEWSRKNKGQDVFYCRLSSTAEDTIIHLLRESGQLFLVIDDCHEDEQTACEIHEHWELLREDGSHRDSQLLLLAQPYYGSLDGERTKNIYHNVGMVIDSLPSDEEFGAMARHQWKLEHQSAFPEDLAQQALALCQRLPAFLPFAVTLMKQSDNRIFHEHSAKALRQRFFTSIARSYRLEEFRETARRAAIFGHYNILIEKEAFGKEYVDELLEIGFLTRFRRGRFFFVASTILCQLWLSIDPPAEREIELCFEQYIKHQRSNYALVLSGLRSRQDFANLKRLANNSMQTLRQRLRVERDLRIVAEVLRTVEAISRKNALTLLQYYQERGDLPRAIRRERLPRLARFLDAATRLTRSLQELKRATIVDALEQRLLEEGPRLKDISRICIALNRVDAERARVLLQRVLSSLRLPAELDANASSVSLSLLIFSGEVSSIDRTQARDLLARFGESDYSKILTRTKRPFAARRVLESVRTLSRREANEVFQEILGEGYRKNLRAWFSRLVHKPTHLYNLAHLILDVKRVSSRVAYQFAERFEPHLLEATIGEQRLPAVGYLLGVLQKVCSPVARRILESLSDEGNLFHMLHREQSPGRFGRTILSICSIDIDPARRYFQAHCSDNELSERLQRASSLSEVGLLLMGVGEMSPDPDDVVRKLLDSPINRLVLEELGLRSTHIEEFSAFVNVIGAASPFSHDVKRRLGVYISESNILHALEVEMRARKVGAALRAYAIAFPSKCRRYVLDLVSGIQGQDKDLRESSVTRMKGWLTQENLSSIGFLLNSASAIDARLAQTVADPIFLSSRRIESEVEREGNLLKISEFLYSLSSLTQETSHRAVRRIFSPMRVAETMDACPDLRAFVTVFQAFREADQKLYYGWVKGALAEHRELVSREIRSRVREETNLGIISTCLRLVSGWERKDERQMAQTVLGQITHRWLLDVARWDNEVVQVMDFASAFSVASQTSQVQVFHGSKNDLQSEIKIHEILDVEYMQRLGELRSLRALTIGLQSLLQLSGHLKSDTLLRVGWNSFRHDVIMSSLRHTDDTTGCGFLSILLGLLGRLEPAAELVSEVEYRVRHLIGSDESNSRVLCAAGLISAGRETLEQHSRFDSLFSGRGPVLWSIGFANWLFDQRRRILGLANEGQLLVSMADFRRHGWSDNDLRIAVQDECVRSGGNIFFLFTVMASRQLGLGLERSLEEQIVAIGLKRRDKEWRWSIKERLRAYCVDDRDFVEYSDLPFLAHAIRKFLPRLTTVGLPEEPELEASEAA